MNGQYLIPANSKKSGMILGLFTPIDLIIFGSGVGLTLILLLAMQASNFTEIVIILLPALISGFLVFPVPNYHNVLQLIINIVTYFFKPKDYIWRGWDYKNGDKK